MGGAAISWDLALRPILDCIYVQYDVSGAEGHDRGICCLVRATITAKNTMPPYVTQIFRVSRLRSDRLCRAKLYGPLDRYMSRVSLCRERGGSPVLQIPL